MIDQLFLQGYHGAAPKELSPLALAYIGDGVFEMLVRTKVMSEGELPVAKLHKKAKAIVNAQAQSAFYYQIAPLLTEEEEAVFRRGRNAKSHTLPKNADVLCYRRATGVEALFGYLFLSGRLTRLWELFCAGVG